MPNSCQIIGDLFRKFVGEISRSTLAQPGILPDAINS